MGVFTWGHTPGIRLVVNVLLLVVVSLFVGAAFVEGIKELVSNPWDGGSWGGAGCFTILLFFVGLAVWGNVRDHIWSESFSITSERIERTHYPTIWKAQKEILEWNSLSGVTYSPDTIFESTTWIKVFRSTGKPSGGRTEEGVRGRVIRLYRSTQEPPYDLKKVEIRLEKRSYDTSKGDFINSIFGWVFGSEDFTISPEEENRLKEAIAKRLPQKLKENLNDESKQYFGVAR